MNRAQVYGVICALFLISFTLNATTIVLPEDDQLVAKSPVIIEAVVEAVRPVDQGGSIWTETTLSVTRTLKGSVPAKISVREPGGELGDRITKIFGAPEFTPGERVLLFLSRDPRRDGYRVVDLFVGKFSAGETTNGRRLWLRDDSGHDVLLLDRDFRHVHARNAQREAAGFEKFVGERVAGRAGSKNYAIENPVLRRGAQARLESDEGSTSITSNFTLISEPTVYRWFRFDNGQTAQWYHSGAQTGYSDGGLSELRSGMDSWTSYSGARINYVYSGAQSGSLGGMTRRNNVNEILFNDPLNEIEGTWNRTTGGTVGLGGFNGVATGGMWTAPFSADASHPAGAIRAYEIVEANLVIQDGVSPANGISSTRLAEILAHEFGHTLGFGHSSDNTALMWSSVTGLGPSLREDDRLAARWLYPNGTAGQPTVTVPAAPTNLTGTISGNNLDLKWTDNANNESLQSIYLAAGSAAFSKIADVAANATSARISGLAAGSYRAYVVATNSAGSSAASNTVTATVASIPVAAFSFTPSSGTAGVTTFTFYDESTGGITSRQWSFGDGSTSTAAVASHVYARSGVYTVTLTVTGSGGSASLNRTVTVNAGLSASFSFAPAAPTAGELVRFTDESAGAPTSWRWTFSDGTVSTLQNPAKQFAVAGTHAVSLTVYRGSESASTSRNVSVFAPAPVTPAVVAAFDLPASAIAGTGVNITDQSSGSPTAWAWSFGDGRTSNLRNPVHTWSAPGTYHVTLTASNGTSSGTTSRTISITQVAAFRTLVSVAAQTPGIGGTSWRTELSLFNAGSVGSSAVLTYVPAAGSTVQTRTLFLSPRQSVTYSNALLDLFGIASGAGAIGIEATAAGVTPDLRVTSRTFTTGTVGTYGQAVPDVKNASLDRTLYLTGIQSNASYRTNVGIVNKASSTVNATLSLHAGNGALIATKALSLPPNSFQQSSLATYFPAIEGQSHSVLSMRASISDQDAVSVYASVVDNASQDPIYIQAVPLSAAGTVTLPVVGRAVGANGTFWRSDVTLHNPSSATTTVTLRFNGVPRYVTLQPAQTHVVADVLSVYGLSSGGGSLDIVSSGTSGPVVTSRTYTTSTSGGTYGQSIEPIARFASQMFVPGLRNDQSYRTNVGFVNGGDDSRTFAVAVLSAWGGELARTYVTLGAKEQVQHALTALFPGLSSSLGNFTLLVEGNPGSQLFAYGSMVDNASGDPVFFAAQ